MDYVCAIATEIVELINYLFIMTVLFHCKLNQKKYIPVIVLSVHAVIWMICIAAKGNLTVGILVANLLSIMISIFLIVDEVLWKKGVYFLIAYAFAGCLEMGIDWLRLFLAHAIFNKKIEISSNLNWADLFNCMMVFLCLILLSFIFNKIEKKYRLMLSRKMMILIMALMYCFTIIISYIVISTQYVSNTEFNVVAVCTAFILVVLLIVYIVSYMITYYSKNFYQQQNEQKQKMLAVQKQYFQSIEANQEKIRLMQHDMKNMIGTVSIMMENNSYEEAKGYLEKWQDELSGTKFIKVTQNSTIDAVLHYENMEAMSKNVVIDMHSSVPNWDDVEEYKLCTILLNALSNAVEAASEIADEREKCVKLKMVRNQNAIYITVENASDRKAQEIQDGITTKEGEGHGYGIKNIREAVESFHGSMEYRQKGGKIVLEICLFIE